MTQISARGVALAALRAWRIGKDFADATISNALSHSTLQSADRAFALELFFGVLRNLTLLDFWVADLRRAHIEVDLRDILRLGLYQLFIAQTPEHAAVNETVDLASKRQRSIVNAILRSAARDRADLVRKGGAQPLEIRTSHPKFLIDRWKRQFGAAPTATLSEWNNQPPLTYARINRLKIDRQAFLACYRDARPVENRWNFVELRSPIEALAAGHCYVQDPSTAIACDLLAAAPGDKILDACAAPGGKTSYLAELMQNQGLLIATDRNSDRLSILTENLRRLGVSVANVVHQDWTKTPIAAEIISAAPFDRILIDVPCSNTGVVRRRVDVRWRLNPDDFGRMQAHQIEMVGIVLELLKPGGILVYSTCSLEAEENEKVIESVLGAMPNLRFEEERRSLPFRDHFDGAFVAKLRRVK